MADGTNAVAPYFGGNAEDALNAIGVTQFPSDTNWYQTIGGILIQGGFVSAAAASANTTVNFNVGFTVQVLHVWIQNLGTSLLGSSVDNVALDQFDIVNDAAVRDFYWVAIGV